MGTNSKLLARAEHAVFVGMKIEKRFCRTFNPAAFQVNFVRLADFKPHQCNQLPFVMTLINGLSLQSADKAKKSVNSFAEEILHKAFAVELSFFAANNNLRDPRFLDTFEDDIQHHAWNDIIDREYNALCKWQTWS